MRRHLFFACPFSIERLTRKEFLRYHLAGFLYYIAGLFLNIKALLFCSFFILVGCQTNTLNQEVKGEPTEQAKKVAQLAQTLATADSEYKAYQEANRAAWAYEQLAKCQNISNNDYEQMFFRYMQKKHPIESQQVLYDPSPSARRLTKIFADIFVSEEVNPRALEFYLANERCPYLNELDFPY